MIPNRKRQRAGAPATGFTRSPPFSLHPIRPEPTQSGFTILEFTVVIALIAVLTVFTLHGMLNTDEHTKHAAYEEVTSHLLHARAFAMSCERTCRISFNVASNGYDVQVADTNSPGSYVTAEDPARRGPWSVAISDLFPGVQLDAVNINGGNVLIFSARTGAPADSTGGVLSANAVIRFTSGAQVLVTPDTGHVAFTE
jgi:prepilin-type N-terminal cleavage/methylation domain-containing protein